MLTRVKIEIISGLYEDFLNYLIENEFYITKVRRTDFGITLICAAKDYCRIAKLARKFQCRTKVVKRKGVYFRLRRLITRKSVAVAVLSVFIYIFLFSKLIWRIDVITPNQNITEDVYGLLYKNEVYTGAVFNQDKNQNIIQQIFMNVEDVGYVTLNFYKGILTCKVDPVVERMPYLDSSFEGNIVATQNGVIEDLRVYSGFSQVKTGQSVTQGDVLVSATYIDRNGTLQQVMPRAYIKANCVKKYVAQVKLEKDVYLRTGDFTQRKTIKFAGKNFVIDKENLGDYTNYDVERTFEYADILGFKIPLTIEKVKYYRKELIKISKDEHTAYSAAKSIVETLIKNDISLEEIDSKKFEHYVQENVLNMTCTVQGHYDITK